MPSPFIALPPARQFGSLDYLTIFLLFYYITFIDFYIFYNTILNFNNILIIPHHYLPIFGNLCPYHNINLGLRDPVRPRQANQEALAVYRPILNTPPHVV